MTEIVMMVFHAKPFLSVPTRGKEKVKFFSAQNTIHLWKLTSLLVRGYNGCPHSTEHLLVRLCLPTEDLWQPSFFRWKTGQMIQFMQTFQSWGNERFLQFPKDMERVVHWRNYYFFIIVEIHINVIVIACLLTVLVATTVHLLVNKIVLLNCDHIS